MNPQRQDRHQAIRQSFDLVAGKEVDGQVALRAFVVPDRQTGSRAPRQDGVGVLDLGTDSVDAEAEESTGRNAVNRRSNVGVRLRFCAVLEDLNADDRSERRTSR